jgi:hypothetical protein
VVARISPVAKATTRRPAVASINTRCEVFIYNKSSIISLALQKALGLIKSSGECGAGSRAAVRRGTAAPAPDPAEQPGQRPTGSQAVLGSRIRFLQLGSSALSRRARTCGCSRGQVPA